MDEKRLDLTRRKVLGGLTAIGGAAALGGAGTLAFFSDEERFANNQVTAGEFDLMVDWQVTYTGPNGLEYTNAWPDNYQNDPNDLDQLQTDALGFPQQGSDGVQDPIMSRSEIAGNNPDWTDEEVEQAFRSQFADIPDDYADPLVELSDVKPGDAGQVSISLHLFDNPGHVWLTGELLANRENSVNEPERKDPDEDNVEPVPEGEVDDEGELADGIRCTVWSEDGAGNRQVLLGGNEDPADDPSLATVMALLSQGHGLALDGDAEADGRSCFVNSTTAYVGLDWELPVDHANEVQSDSVTFDLGVYAEQCRHNDSGAGQLRRAIPEAFMSPEGLPDEFQLDDHCVSAPPQFPVDAAMGFHAVNQGAIDDTVDPLSPEAFVYADMGSGLELVAVEYLATEAFEVFGEQSDPPVAIPFHSLHIWAWEHNPLGDFAQFNPRVECDHD